MSVPDRRRVALITGGTKGIGRAVAERASRDFAHVIVNFARDEQAAVQAASAIEQGGAVAHTVRADIGEDGGVAAVGRVVDGVGEPLDLLVHGAAWATPADPLTFPLADFDRAVRTNGSSLLHLVRAVDHLLANRAAVVFLSSRGAKAAIDGYLALGAPKALAESIVRYLAVALAPREITVNSISPSGIPTEAVYAVLPDAERRLRRMQERSRWPRAVEPTDVAEAVAVLWRNELPLVTGNDLIMDGGFHLQA